MLLPPQAASAASCTFDPGSGSIEVVLSKRAAVAREGETILVNGKPCADATVTNTILIRLIGDRGYERAKINLGGGPYAPGRTDGETAHQRSSSSWSSKGEPSSWLAPTGAITLVRGSLGVNLNGDETSEDLDVPSTHTIHLRGRGGGRSPGWLRKHRHGRIMGLYLRRLRRAGERHDRHRVRRRPELLGRPGYNVLDYSNNACGISVGPYQVEAGCDLDAVPDGKTGIEEVIGTLFRDRFSGNPDDDVYRGRGGSDLLQGWKGRDPLFGNPADDVLEGQGGDDLLDGGAGTDTCDGGKGTNELINCEVTV